MNQLEENRNIYTRYIEIINKRDFDRLSTVADPDKYREICVGYTQGWINFDQSKTSILKVLKGVPNLEAAIEETACERDTVYARLRVKGTQSGRLFGMPATNKSYDVQMFDYVKIENGKIVKRIQQSDSLGQMITLFKGLFIKAGIAVALIIIGLITALILK